MASSAYRHFAWAIENRVPLVCRFRGDGREICPIILGHTDGQEKALVWQTGGETSKGPLKKADWRCFGLDEVDGSENSGGDWRAGLSHRQAQSCVKDVDYDANPNSPYNPTRSLGNLRGKAVD